MPRPLALRECPPQSTEAVIHLPCGIRESRKSGVRRARTLIPQVFSWKPRPVSRGAGSVVECCRAGVFVGHASACRRAGAGICELRSPVPGKARSVFSVVKAPAAGSVVEFLPSCRRLGSIMGAALPGLRVCVANASRSCQGSRRTPVRQCVIARSAAIAQCACRSPRPRNRRPTAGRPRDFDRPAHNAD
jgi:hypothetical protein